MPDKMDTQEKRRCGEHAERAIAAHAKAMNEELKSLQTRLNEVLHVIQLSQELVSCPIVFCEIGYVTSDNVPLDVSTELYDERDCIINQMYQMVNTKENNV